ncbi:MAG: DUF4381 domain-containing protein [Methylococcaceae bacterium]
MSRTIYHHLPFLMHDLPLRDIHLPEPLGLWPLAPGWGLLLLVLLQVLIGWLLWRRWRAQSIIRLAMAQILELEQRDDLPLAERCSRLSCLLRQVCLSLYPRETVAGLTGESWLAFLDQRLKQPGFSAGIGRHLLVAPYEPNPTLTRDHMLALLKLSRAWLKRQPKPGKTTS